jgi:NAD(P)-dependent dehydrogenase (short-subunit alcohol dehydrogenase family)
MDRKLTGRVAFVTGGGRGFGAGIAQGFARAGARVCVTDIDEGELALSHQELAAIGGEVLTLKVDVADCAQMMAAVEQVVARWGRLDVLVSNAATMPLVPFAATTPELWDLILGVNLTGIFNGVRAAWPHLVRQGGGHCIAIASGASVRGFVNEVAYCAAKHGLEGFTKALAMEAEPYNIAVNTMGPGKRIKPTSVTRAQAKTVDPVERAAWVDPLALAPAFVWLASQPPQRFTGLRFDAGPLADTIAAEGLDFAFSPEKVTIYPEDLAERLARRQEWTGVGAR